MAVEERSTDPRSVLALGNLAALLRRPRFHFVSEIELQTGIGHVLSAAGVAYEREVVLTRTDRIDFLVCFDDETTRIGIEVKIKGGYGSAARQLARYAQNPRVDGLLLVTNRLALAGQPHELHGKPVQVVTLLGGLR